ncbi:MAG: response regulator [Acidobacteria bacterium]|nr:response regulator [Acidobacteriota bacterium]
MKRRVIVAVDDLFFAARIRTMAEHLGVEVIFPRSLEALSASATEDALALVIVDLHLQRYDPFLIPSSLKNNDDGLPATPLVGFFSHVQTELQQRAEDAGYDRILPRSAFTKRLPEILSGNDNR